MNPDFMAMVEDALARGFRVMILTNAMRPMMKCAERLIDLQARYAEGLTLRVSVDHYTKLRHQMERGVRSWNPMIKGLRWLAEHGFAVHLAGRTYWNEDEASLREGYRAFIADLGLKVDAADPMQMVLFPEMDEKVEVPEITTACWDILDVDPAGVMCASSRMVVKRKGADKPTVIACTLLPYDTQFEMGETLAQAAGAVKLNHPHCAKFCVLGGGSCSKS